MTVEEIIATIVGSGIIYMLTDRFKVHLADEKHVWLPEIAVAQALALVLAAYYATGPHPQEVWLLAVLKALVVGFGAVGIHSAKKQHQVS